MFMMYILFYWTKFYFINTVLASSKWMSIFFWHIFFNTPPHQKFCPCISGLICLFFDLISDTSCLFSLHMIWQMGLCDESMLNFWNKKEKISFFVFKRTLKSLNKLIRKLTQIFKWLKQGSGVGGWD